MYIKGENVHFCTSDLVPRERHTIGIDQNLVIFTYANEAFHIIRDNDAFTNFMVIDSANKILLYKNDSTDTYVLQKVDDKNFIIAEKKGWERCIKNTPSEVFVRYPWMNVVWDSFVFLEKEYKKDYNLCYYINNTFFIKNGSEQYSHFVVAMQRGKGIVYQGRLDNLWIHKNGKSEIISFRSHSYNIIHKNDNEGKAEEYQTTIVDIITLDNGNEYSFRASDYINHVDILHNNTELDYYDDKRLFSDIYLIVPFSYGFGTFVIRNVDGDISAYTIKFNTTYENNRYRSYRIYLINDILKITVTYDGFSEIDNYYYDVWGNYLGHTYGRGWHYLIFANTNNSKSPFTPNELKGIIKVNDDFSTDKNDVKVLAPPFFSKIETMDEEHGVFKVWLRNYIEGENDDKVDLLLYSEKSGLIVYDGYTDKPYYYNYYGEYEEPCEEYYGDPIAACKRTTDFLIFTNENKKGLLFKGEKVLDAQYDEIEGFNYVDKFGEQSERAIIRQTVEYKPLSVILCEYHESKHYGLFFQTANESAKGFEIISPIYDSIRCEKIFNGHAYFKVEKDRRLGIISDDYSFNIRTKVEYDDVRYGGIVSGECFFIVKNMRKFGAVCTKEEFNIPLLFEDIDLIVKSGVLCHNKLYDRKGNELFYLGDKYEYLKTEFMDVFMSLDSKDYVFINSQGKQINYTKDEDNEFILQLDGGWSFNTEENVFIEEKHDYYEGYDYPDDYDYERDTWNAMTDGQYGEMPEGFDGDYDFTGH